LQSAGVQTDNDSARSSDGFDRRLSVIVRPSDFAVREYVRAAPHVVRERRQVGMGVADAQ